MKAFINLTLFLILICNHSFSQETYKVKGNLSSGEEEIPYVSVILKHNADSSVAKLGITDSLGNFTITGVNSGQYFLSSSRIGYLDYSSKSFTVEAGDVDLGRMELVENSEMMNAVTVSQLRPVIEIMPDKMVFNVENTINSTGANGFELLRKAPGVIIDNSNNIILEGKSGVQIYIDNKASILSGDDLVNFLMSLQASNIDAIEIITQPSSKYDAAGNAGIINIMLKRDKRLGTNGSVGAGYSYGENHRVNSSLSLNHRNKKSNIYSTYSNNFGQNGSFLYFDRTQENVLYSSETDSKRNVDSHNGKIGVDWFLDPKHTVGVLATGSFFNTGSIGNTTTNIIPVGGNIDQVLIADNSTVGQNYQLAGNLNYRFADTLGHELIIDGDYGIYDRDANSFQPNQYLDGPAGSVLYENNYRMITPTEIQIATGKIDYSQYFLKGKLSFGGKYSMVKTDNTFEFYNIIDGVDQLNESRSNQFAYTENINAVYVNYSKRLSMKWNFQIGLRGEQTNSVGELTSAVSTGNDTVSRHYFNLFPSGGITYAPNQKHIWSLNFSRRIQRPNYQSLNPFESQIDELSFMKGNPFLQPQYISNAKLSHTFMYRFNTSLSYSYVQDFFAQITDTLGATKSFLTPRNVANQSTVNLTISLPMEIKKWWNVFVNLSAFNTSFTGTDDKFQAINRSTVSLYAQNAFLLKKGFKFEVSGWFSSPSIWGGTYLTKSMGSLDLALEKKFLDDRLALRVSANDIFFTSPWRADLQYGNLIIYGTGGYESRRVNLNLTYKFGNQDVKRYRNRKTGMEDEEKRTAGQ